MKDTKVYQIINSFSTVQTNRLSKFLNSPYFNQNQNLIQLFELIVDSHKNNSPISKEGVWNQIYGKEKYVDVKLRKLNSDLFAKVEDFMAQETFENKDLYKKSFLLEYVSSKESRELYRKSANRLRKSIEKQHDKSANLYFNKYLVEKSYFELSSEFEKKIGKGTKTFDVNIDNIVKNLDLFFIAEKLRYLCTMHTLKNIMNLDAVSQYFVEEIISVVRRMEIDEFPSVKMYYLIYMTTIDPEDSNHYNNLKSHIQNYLHYFPIEEAKNIYESIFNYCIRKVNKGKFEYNQEALDLYKYALEYDILITENELSPTSFRNIVTFSLRVGEISWAEKFIDKYQEFLQPKFKDSAVSYNMARIAWYKKDFDGVLELLQNVEYEDLLYNLNSKIMILSVYYENDDHTSLDYFVRSYKAYISRNPKIEPSLRRSFLNFVKYINRISKTASWDKTQLQAIRLKIEEEKLLISKTWLIEKLDELEGKKVHR